MGDHQIGAGFLRPLHHQLGGVGLDGIVRVHKLQVLATGLPQSQIAGGRHAAVGLVNDHDAVIHPCEHLTHLQTHVLRTIVEQDNFQILVGLFADALHTTGNVVLGVVDGHNDAHQRLFHGNPSFIHLFYPKPCKIAMGAL